MKVSVNEKVFQKFPNLVELIVVAKNVNNQTSKSRDIIKALRTAEDGLRQRLSSESFKGEPRYKSWIDAYEQVLEDSDAPGKFKKKMIPAHVALAERVLAGKELPNINPLVNHYNALSLSYGIPFGAEDLDSYVGNIELKPLSGGEKFLAIGGDKTEEAYRGEYAWIDNHSISCRMWGWRQADRTKVEKTSKNVIYYIDIFTGVDGIDEDYIKSIGDSIIADLSKYFEAEANYYLLSEKSREVDIDYNSQSLGEYGGIEAVEQYFDDSSNDEVEKGTKGIRRRKADPIGLIDDSLLEYQLNEYIKNALENSEYEGVDPEVQEAPDPKFGDYSTTIALRLAKQIGKNPTEIGEEIVQLINNSGNTYKANLARNNFINIAITDKILLEDLERALGKGEDYGSLTAGKGKTILVESPSWNPNKTAHVGHLLNLLLGKSLVRLFDKVGFKGENDNIDNDKGLPVQQTVWAYSNFGEGKTPESEGIKPDHFVHKFYVLGKQKYDESEEIQEQVKETLRKWEAKDPETIAIWEKVKGWAYEGQIQTFNRLGEQMGYEWHESDVYNGGKAIVEEAVGKGVIEKLPDGALIARIEQEYGLPDTIVLKRDGTGLYHTQDIYLTIKKKEVFNDPYKMIWVVGEEQIAHFQRLFAILDAMDIMPIENLYHFAYSHVVNKDGGKLASRDGADMSADEMLDQMKNAALTVLNERSEGKVEDADEVAELVGQGALKFALLSTDPFKKIKFDAEKAVSFTGKSGPYIMYAYTRGKSLLEKVYDAPELGTVNEYDLGDIEKELLLSALRYPKAVLSAANNYSPSILAEYLYNLAKTFSNFYENVSVGDANDEEKAVRVAIVKLVTHILQDGLEILGIRVLDRM